MNQTTSQVMKQLIFEHNLAVTLSRNGINPPEDESNVERFYEWMKKIKNKYVDNQELMIPAIRKISLNQ